MQPAEDRQAVRALVACINRAWRQSRFADLPDCFAEDAVMVGPGPAVLGRGRAFFVESYRDFAASVTVLAYTETDPLIEVFGDLAICVYDWTMTYRRDESAVTESGSDEFVAVRGGTQWRVVWRQIRFAAPGG